MQAIADETLAEELGFAIGLETQAEDAFDPGATGGQEDNHNKLGQALKKVPGLTRI